jgi:hypothetical protein
MIKEKISFLAKGLVKGFAGNTDRKQISRGGFDFETSHLGEGGVSIMMSGLQTEWVEVKS